MICSNRSNKTGSNWLDRLRSNKGIPTDDDIDLDSFLLRLTTHSPQPRPIKPPRRRPTTTHHPPLTAVLAHLFNPGATVSLISNKCPRKQRNPKNFIASSSTIINNAPTTTAATGGDVVVEVEDRCVEDNDGEEDLKGFTRSEVTVIDTSCPRWKVDKLVFRKNSVWKVRERKSKTKFFANNRSKTTRDLQHHGTGNSKDNVVKMGGEKPVKKLKV